MDLQTRLRQIRGKFLLSLDDHPEVRRIFGEWHLLPLTLAYTAQKKIGRRYPELLITNFPVSLKSHP